MILRKEIRYCLFKDISNFIFLKILFSKLIIKKRKDNSDNLYNNLIPYNIYLIDYCKN